MARVRCLQDRGRNTNTIKKSGRAGNLDAKGFAWAIVIAGKGGNICRYSRKYAFLLSLRHGTTGVRVASLSQVLVGRLLRFASQYRRDTS